MASIYEINANDNFDFSSLLLISPQALGGSYLIKCLKRDTMKEFYLKTPECLPKQGLVKTGKKMYCDLMFTHNDEFFIKWIEQFETYCQQKIYENRASWFQSDLELPEIENSFSTALKAYKSGKYHVLRAQVPVSVAGKCDVKIYDENHSAVDAESITTDQKLITLLEIQGIMCSAHSFQIEFGIKQILVVNNKN